MIRHELEMSTVLVTIAFVDSVIDSQCFFIYHRVPGFVLVGEFVNDNSTNSFVQSVAIEFDLEFDRQVLVVMDQYCVPRE